MASLYLQHGFTQQALDVYRALLLRTPDDTVLTERVHDLEAQLNRPTDETALEADADKALQFDELSDAGSGPDAHESVLEAMYDLSPPSEVANSFGAAWTPATGDDWFAADGEHDPIGESADGPGAMFGVDLEGLVGDRAGGIGSDPYPGTSAARAGVVLESVFGAPTVATADEAAAEMMVRLTTEMVGRLPKEAPTLPVPEVLELPSAVAGDQATGASPAPLLSFDRFFSGSGSPPRPRIDTPVRQANPAREVSPLSNAASPSLSPTFGGVPVIPPSRSTPAPNWAGFDQFLTPAASAVSPQSPFVTPPQAEPSSPPASAATGALWTPPAQPTPVPQVASPITPAAARPPIDPVPLAPAVPSPPPAEVVEPEPPRAAPSEFHRWLEGLS